MSSASGLRRSPRKKASKPAREASHKNVDNTNKTPRGLQAPSQSENSQEIFSPSRAFSKGIQGQLKEMQATQKELLSTMKVMRNEVRDLKREFEKRKEETQEVISVPNRIRNNVKEFYACGEDRELKWDFKKRYNDEAKKEMTDFIKKSVKGIAPDVSNEVLDAAVKRYFTSKKDGATRKAKNKDQLHRQRQASYERKNEKLRRRLVTTEKKKNWTEEKKTSVKKFLSHKQSYKYMSSDEEGGDGFISHPYTWESDTWKNVKDSLDKKYLGTCPPRSRRLVQKRTKGSAKEQPTPEFEEEFSSVFK